MNSLDQNQHLLSICSKKLEKNPYNIKALLLHAYTNIKLNSLSQAENDIFNIINQNPNSSPAYYLLGIISQKKKNFQQSLFYFTRAIELDPNNINAIYSRAAVYNELNFYKKAIDDYYLAFEKDNMQSSEGNVYKNLNNLIEEILDEEENDKNNLYSNKDDIELNAEINNYMYEQLKILSLQNNDNIQYEFINENNKENDFINERKSNKEKENDVKEIYDLNQENSNENEVLFDQRNSNIDNIIKIKNMEKNINEDKMIENNKDDKMIEVNNNKKSIKYHNEGHIINDVINNEANIMISQEEDTENIININSNKPSININDNQTTKEIHENPENIENKQLIFDIENQKKISQSQQYLDKKEISSNINNHNIQNKKYEKWELYHNQGYSARKKDNFELAIEYYTKAINLNPNYFKAYFNRGFAYDKISQYDKAIKDYSKAIEINPNSAYAYYNRAISYDKKGELNHTLEGLILKEKLKNLKKQ